MEAVRLGECACTFGVPKVEALIAKVEVRGFRGGERASGVDGCRMSMPSSIYSGAKFANWRYDASTGDGRSSRGSKQADSRGCTSFSPSMARELLIKGRVWEIVEIPFCKCVSGCCNKGHVVSGSMIS